MREVDTVLEDILRMHLQAFAVQPHLGVVVGGAAAVGETGEHVRRVEVGSTTVDVVPDVDRVVALDDREGSDAPATIGAVLIRDADVATVAVPLPPVERALQDLPDDVSDV